MESTIDEAPAAVIAEDKNIESAQKMFQSGKKIFLLNKFDEAESIFSDLCKIYSEHYGDLGAECAEIYYYYGRSLLELARSENTALNNKNFNNAEEDDDDDTSSDNEEVASGKVTDEDNKEKEVQNDDDDGNEVTYLQNAWEMFETAKLVYSKNFNEDPIFKNKHIAECLIKLGEISIEEEQYERAIGDIKEAINVQETLPLESRDERMLAESYYQYGLVYQLSERYSLAREQYQKSVNILQLRIDKLKSLVDEKNEDEKLVLNEEIVDIEEILPEIVSKLEEIREQENEIEKEVKKYFLPAEPEKIEINNDNDNVKDITSFIKRKTKNEKAIDGSKIENDKNKKRKSEENS